LKYRHFTNYERAEFSVSEIAWLGKLSAPAG
jgi:hypothetical protein